MKQNRRTPIPIPKRALAILLVFALLFGTSGGFSAQANDPPVIIERGSPEWDENQQFIWMNDHGILYSAHTLRMIWMQDTQAVGLIHGGDELMAGEARFVRISPWWIDESDPSFPSLVLTWDVPGFGGIEWSSSDESVFRVQFTGNDIAGGVENPIDVWVVSENPGTAYLDLTLRDYNIIIRQTVTVVPRPATFPLPDTFSVDPHVLHVPTGGDAVTTLSLPPGAPMLPGITSPIVTDYVSSNPDIAALEIHDFGSDQQMIGTMRDGHLDVNVFGLQPGTTIITMFVMTLVPFDVEAGIWFPYGTLYNLEVIVSDDVARPPPTTQPGQPNRPQQPRPPSEPVPAESLRLNPSSAIIHEGGRVMLRATVEPRQASTMARLEFSSSNPNIAWVDSFGNVFGVNPGVVVITARTTDGSDLSAMAVVTVRPRLVERIILSPVSRTIDIGEEFALSATAMPTNATNRELAYTVSDPDIIFFENGVVTGLQPGAATITFEATDGSGVYATARVTVREPQFVGIMPMNAGAQNPMIWLIDLFWRALLGPVIAAAITRMFGVLWRPPWPRRAWIVSTTSQQPPVRSRAASGAPISIRLRQNNEIRIVGQDGNWFRFAWNRNAADADIFGYIHNSHVVFERPAQARALQPLYLGATWRADVSNYVRPIRIRAHLEQEWQEFGKRSSTHAGIDFWHYEGTPVFAATNGRAVRYLYFEDGTMALEVINSDGTILRYGELIAAHELRVPRRQLERYQYDIIDVPIRQGQKIGYLHPFRTHTVSPMLHLEHFRGRDQAGNPISGTPVTNRLTVRGNRNYYFVTNGNFSRRRDLLDPTPIFNLPLW